MAKINVKATFEFIAKYPIQMLIGGGILLILIGQIFRFTGASFNSPGSPPNALMQAGSSTTWWGAGILFLGVVVLIIYWGIRNKRF